MFHSIRFSPLAYREKAAAEPVFGAGWFESTIEIDNVNRIVRPTDFKATETRFPDGTPDITSALTTGLESQSAQWNLDFSLDELDAALKTADAETNAAEKLNTQPPDIIYRDRPALLITMDGQPAMSDLRAIACVGGALGMLTSRNVVHAAYWLLEVMLASTLSAPFTIESCSISSTRSNSRIPWKRSNRRPIGRC